MVKSILSTISTTIQIFGPKTDLQKKHNVATTFGKTHLKDEQGNDLYLNKLDIDSDEVFTRLANIRIKDKDYFFIDEMCQKTYVTKTRKKWDHHIFWLSYKPHPSVGY